MWDDFLGPVDRTAPRRRVALTAASLSWSYEYEIERDAGRCAYWVTVVHAQAIFNRGDSWVRPAHRNAAVLKHEQGHFDLAQIYKLLLDGRARPLLGARGRCEGRSIRAATAFAEREIGERVEKLFDGVWREFVAAQEAYDDATGHGTVIESQSRWTERIGRALRSGHWQAFIAELDQ